MLTAFGDSIVKTVDLCGQKLGISTLNYARMGATAPQGEQLIERYKLLLKPNQIVFIGYGLNDCAYDWTAIAAFPNQEHYPRTSLREYKEAYTRIIETVRGTGAVPVVLSLPPMDADRYFHFFSRYWTEEEKENVLQWLGGSTTHIAQEHELYNTTTWKIAQEQGVQVIDIKNDLLADGDYLQYLSEDGIHPNEKGQAKIADLIAKLIAA